ncbi:MAG: hypothetical protein ABFD89_12550 [Bryobacteraceae bacterium]
MTDTYRDIERILMDLGEPGERRLVLDFQRRDIATYYVRMVGAVSFDLVEVAYASNLKHYVSSHLSSMYRDMAASIQKRIDALEAGQHGKEKVRE